MRLPAVVVPAVFLLAGTCYFFTRAKASASSFPGASRWDRPAPAPDSGTLPGTLDDDSDRELVRQLLAIPNLTDSQANTLVAAAGRRYMRRKQAYAAAQQAAGAGRALDGARQEMELARKVCDVAESLGPRIQEIAAAAQADGELERRWAVIPSAMSGLAERFDGATAFTEADLAGMESAFLKTFGKPLPVSTRGDSAVHRAMGFDHRGRFDLALAPSQPEGVWARHYLAGKNATFLAFSSAVPGRATGAHIHIGPPSTHRAPH